MHPWPRLAARPAFPLSRGRTSKPASRRPGDRWCCASGRSWARRPRPPAEAEVKAISNEQMNRISAFLLGISIELLVSQGFHSEIKDDYEAIISIIKRHPMNQFEIKSFLKTRNCEKIDGILAMLELSENINVIKYRGFSTYRLK